MEKRQVGRPSTKVDRICLICRGRFQAKVSEVERGAGRYCGYVCSAEARRRGVKSIADPAKPRRPTVERYCEACGDTFKVYPHRDTPARPARFCSERCRLTRPALRITRHSR